MFRFVWFCLLVFPFFFWFSLTHKNKGKTGGGEEVMEKESGKRLGGGENKHFAQLRN